MDRAHPRTLRDFFILYRARFRLAWSIFFGHAHDDPGAPWITSYGQLLHTLTVKALGDQEREIAKLKEENEDLRARLAGRDGQPYR